MIVSIHQSQYLPWPAYFKKIAISDKFILLDDVQFQKNGVQNRNKLRNKNSDFWLTIPLSGSLEDKINEKIPSNDKWIKKHLQSITQSYSKAPYWSNHSDKVSSIYEGKLSRLDKINKSFIDYILMYLEIETDILLSSELQVEGQKSELVHNLCKKVGATHYISGEGAKDYLDIGLFSKNSIEVSFLKSYNPIYEQHHGSFIPNLSILDMIMNVDKEKMTDYLQKN